MLRRVNPVISRILRVDFVMNNSNYDVKKPKVSVVMTAHHQDDVLETYLMQKQRKSQVDFFGLKSEVTIYHVKVLRPLLSYTKQQLIDYCAEFKISYVIDDPTIH